MEGNRQPEKLNISLLNFEDPKFEESKYVLTSPRSLEACARLNFKPVELLRKPLRDFQEELLPKGIPTCTIFDLYDEHEKERISKLRLCLEERQRIVEENYLNDGIQTITIPSSDSGNSSNIDNNEIDEILDTGSLQRKRTAWVTSYGHKRISAEEVNERALQDHNREIEKREKLSKAYDSTSIKVKENSNSVKRRNPLKNGKVGGKTSKGKLGMHSVERLTNAQIEYNPGIRKIRNEDLNESKHENAEEKKHSFSFKRLKEKFQKLSAHHRSDQEDSYNSIPPTQEEIHAQLEIQRPKSPDDADSAICDCDNEVNDEYWINQSQIHCSLCRIINMDEKDSGNFSLFSLNEANPQMRRFLQDLDITRNRPVLKLNRICIDSVDTKEIPIWRKKTPILKGLPGLLPRKKIPMLGQEQQGGKRRVKYRAKKKISNATCEKGEKLPTNQELMPLKGLNWRQKLMDWYERNILESVITKRASRQNFSINLKGVKNSCYRPENIRMFNSKSPLTLPVSMSGRRDRRKQERLSKAKNSPRQIEEVENSTRRRLVSNSPSSRSQSTTDLTSAGHVTKENSTSGKKGRRSVDAAPRVIQRSVSMTYKPQLSAKSANDRKIIEIMKARREGEAVDNKKRERARIQREKEAETRVSTESLRSRSNSEFHLLREARAAKVEEARKRMEEEERREKFAAVVEKEYRVESTLRRQASIRESKMDRQRKLSEDRKKLQEHRKGELEQQEKESMEAAIKKREISLKRAQSLKEQRELQISEQRKQRAQQSQRLFEDRNEDLHCKQKDTKEDLENKLNKKLKIAEEKRSTLHQQKVNELKKSKQDLDIRMYRNKEKQQKEKREMEILRKNELLLKEKQAQEAKLKAERNSEEKMLRAQRDRLRRERLLTDNKKKIDKNEGERLNSIKKYIEQKDSRSRLIAKEKEEAVTKSRNLALQSKQEREEIKKKYTVNDFADKASRAELDARIDMSSRSFTELCFI
ncbi:DgyrCDS9785 [Dimorphilus gyrociliatus]|uniref:DgyrCDS9785 n=1 Tax=Dimorphilus gyrociliatus TaxID=2664684 RepID=A0A7I8VY02_9ANNE|nr:DgyrCDS9785 [Dimorphilus gyrociliatus]